MSALPPKADIGTQSHDVRFVPGRDERHCSKIRTTSSVHGLDGSQMPESSTPASALALKQQKTLWNQITSIFVVC
jgi:hypothetical protein